MNDDEAIKIPTEKDSVAIENISIAASIGRKSLVLAETIMLPGTRASFIDKQVENFIVSSGGSPANLEVKGYGYATCISNSTEIVHGLPKQQKILFFGDLVSIDVGVKYNGYYAGVAASFVVGGPKSHINRLPYKILRTCQIALESAINILEPGILLNEYGKCVNLIVSKAGFTVVKLLTGHSIGYNYHELPRIYNFYHPYNEIELKENMVLAFELMITNGTGEYLKDKDGWTLSTEDGSLAAHFEHTVLITATGTEILSDRKNI